MPHRWKAETIDKLAEFPTAIWWLLRASEHKFNLVDDVEIAGINPGELFSDQWWEKPAGQVFGDCKPAYKDRAKSYPLLADIPPNVLCRLIELAGNDGLAAPILSDRSVCYDKSGKCRIVTPTKHQQPDINEETIIIGIIDDSIALANANFRDADGNTRFAQFWQQDATCICKALSNANESKVSFGREYNYSEIDDEFGKSTINGELDEESIYVGMYSEKNDSNRFRRISSHGTHVADLAGGLSTPGGGHREDPLRGADPKNVKLIGVNLPTNVVADTSGTYFQISAISAIARILEHVRLMEEKWKSKDSNKGKEISIPIVINLSFALMGGDQKGSALIAQYMDHSVRKRAGGGKAPLKFVLPAGNHFHSRLVGRYTIRRENPRDIMLRVGPDNLASTYVEIRALQPTTVPAKSSLVVQVTPSVDYQLATDEGAFDPAKVDSVDMFRVWILAENDGGGKLRRKCGIFYSWRPQSLDLNASGNGMGHETATIAIPPTQSDFEGDKLPPPGFWTIRLRASNEFPSEDFGVEVSVLRNDIPTRSNPRFQSSWLEDDCYRKYDDSGFLNEDLRDPGSDVVRTNTLNSMATGREVLVVGAIRASDQKLSPYSSAAPDERTSSHGDVSVTTIADDGLTIPGVLATGIKSGSTSRMSGTSVASPQIARIVAGELLSWHKSKNPDLGSLHWLKRLAKREDYGPKKPEQRTGAGGIKSRRRRVT